MSNSGKHSKSLCFLSGAHIKRSSDRKLSTMIRNGIFVRSLELLLDFLANFVLNPNLYLSGKLLNALLSGLSDRSPSVRRSYATAIGHLVKVTNFIRFQSKD